MKINYQLIFLVLFTFLLATCLPLEAQVSAPKNVKSNKANTSTGNAGAKINWIAKPFDHQIFVENKGQFEGPENGDKILYGAQVGNLYVFITTGGLVYKYTEHPEVRVTPDKKQYEVLDPDEVDLKKKAVDKYVTARWEGSTNNITTIAGEEQTYYYTYPAADNKGTIKANVFKTITCLNVYPGIDVKYMFPEGKDGFKYVLIVHPGANLSAVKLQYEGVKKMLLDNDGSIEINSGWGQFVDHAPQSYYDRDTNNHVVSGYRLKDNSESFYIKNADPDKTLIIDPWATNWTTTYTGVGAYNGAYDLDYDYSGNVYIYGGYNPYQLAKYNSAGVLQWTYNTSNFPYIYYGAFCVDKASGVSFCFEGFGGGSYAYTDKISTTGGLISQLTNNTLDEQWRAAYDLCSHTIAIAGGGTNTTLQAATLDTNNSSYTSVNVLGLPPGSPYHDLCLIASDPITDTTYMASTWTYANPGLDNNVVMRLPMPSLSPTGLSTYDKLNFQECYSPAYVATGHGITNGMNGMAVSPNWLYVYDGDTLRQIDKNTGGINASVNVSNTYFNWGGLAVDLCDDIYAGNATSVDLYNSSLSLTGTIGTFPGNVYDVVLGNGVLASEDSTLYVCGKGFVSSVHIDPPSPPTVIKSHTYVCTCNCTATGTLTFCGNPDTSSNVSYLWSDGQTTHTATGLCPGNTYTLTINFGCAQQFQDTFYMHPSDTLSVTKNIVNPTCGLCNGSAGISAVGGGAHYTYLWTPGGQTTDTVTGLCAGTYTVALTDSCGDSYTSLVTLSSIGLSVTASVKANEKCFGDCNGIATDTTIHGVPPYTYSWTPGGQTNKTATGLCAGTYTLTVKDINGCSGTAKVTVTQPTQVTARIGAPTDPVCNGGGGSATATGGGGVSPYTYSWAPVGGTNATGTGLTAGTYTVIVTDANGCTATATTTITQPPLVTATMGVPNNILCNGGTGSVTVTAGGGVSPYTYLWSPHGGTTATGTGLSAATYTVTITDHNGCTATSSVTITQPAILAITPSINQASCGLPNGKATASVTGGTNPYTYLWTPSAQTTATATGLSIGTYSVTVTDKNHCTASATVTITEPSAVTATVTAVTNVSCYQGGNGTATVTAGGGTAPYTYLWNPGANTNAIATGLFALGYTVTVTDINGCTATATTTLTQPPMLSVTIVEPNYICKDSTGIIVASSIGGTAPYKYAWSSGVTTTTATATITPTATRIYSVTVTDANGCTATGQITLEYGPPLNVFVKGKSSVCLGDSTTLCVEVSGGTGGNIYLWEPMNSTNACVTLKPSSTSIYTVSVVDNCGTTVSTTTTVYTDPYPVIGLAADIYQGCAPLCVQFRNGTTLSQGVIGQYVWTFGNGDTIQSKSPIYCYTASGQYNITLTATSDSGCSATLSKSNMITVFTSPRAGFSISPQPANILEPVIQFTDKSADQYGIIYHLWHFGDGSDSTSTLANPVHTYSDTGNYCANLVVMNSHGCTDTATNCLVVEPAYSLYIPSAFTPNGDGIDDEFKPVGKYISNFDMYIFDRWGLQLYHTTDINQGWNGTVHGSGSVVQEDTYIYKITVMDSEGNQHSYVGDITLLK